MKKPGIYLFALLLLICSACVDFSTVLGDKIWLVIAARKWIEGEKLYVDIFESNPPLIVWLYSLPVYLSIHYRSLSDFNYLALLGFSLVGFVIYLVSLIMRSHPAFSHARGMLAEFCLFLAIVLIFYQSPVYFADREHLFFVLTLPYMLRFIPSLAHASVPKWQSIIIGILAGVGFCIKPHFFIVFLGINGVCCIRERSAVTLKSTENIIIYLLTALYLLSILVWTPDYVTTLLPMALATYMSINRRLLGLLYFANVLLSFGITFADFRWRHTSPYRKDIFYLLSVTPFFLIYAIADSGWSYTWNLLTSMSILINGFVLWEYQYLKKEHDALRLPSKSFTFGIRACKLNFIYNAVFIIVAMLSTIPNCGTVYNCEAGKKFVHDVETANDEEPVTSFGSVSADFGVWSYLSRYTGAQWQTRFNHLWMLPKFFISDDAFAARNKWILDYVGHAYAEDLKNNKPELMFVDDKDVFYSAKTYVDLAAFLATRSPEFKAQWAYYTYAGKIEVPSFTVPYPHTHHGVYMYKRTE